MCIEHVNMGLDIDVYVNMALIDQATLSDSDVEDGIGSHTMVDLRDRNFYGGWEAPFINALYTAEFVHNQRVGSYTTFYQWRLQLKAWIKEVARCVSTHDPSSEEEVQQVDGALQAIQNYCKDQTKQVKTLLYALLNCSDCDAVFGTPVCALLAEELTLLKTLLDTRPPHPTQKDVHANIYSVLDDVFFMEKFHIFHYACQCASEDDGCIVFG